VVLTALCSAAGDLQRRLVKVRSIFGLVWYYSTFLGLAVAAELRLFAGMAYLGIKTVIWAFCFVMFCSALAALLVRVEFLTRRYPF